MEVLPDQQSLTFTLNASISPGEWGWVTGGEMVGLVGGWGGGAAGGRSCALPDVGAPFPGHDCGSLI